MTDELKPATQAPVEVVERVALKLNDVLCEMADRKISETREISAHLAAQLDVSGLLSSPPVAEDALKKIISMFSISLGVAGLNGQYRVNEIYDIAVAALAKPSPIQSGVIVLTRQSAFMTATATA